MEKTRREDQSVDREDRRSTPRYTLNVPFGIRFPEGSPKEGWGRILNLSTEGLFVETRFPMRVSGVVYISFLLKGGIRFDNLRARVIRTTYEDGYFLAGIAFDEVVDQETLRDVLSGLSAEGGVSAIS